jgi:uncharacterized membrane protein YphA (DoxX/SURF4 family)
MEKDRIKKWLNLLIATVWITSGLICKVLNIVPRHQEIVARILGNDHARVLTILIGIAETGMGIWIVNGFWSRLNAIIQIILIAAMNILEFILAPDLLLWGKINSVFAFLFIGLIFYKEFQLTKKLI